MSRKLRKTILYWVVLAPLVVLNIFPFAVMFFTAVKPRDELFTYPPRWLPSQIAWQNFADMWAETHFGQALFNSLYVSIGSTILAILIGIPAAYALSRFRFRGQDAYRQYLLITQMVSPMVLVLGLFRLLVMTGAVDSDRPLVPTYAAFNLAFTVMMLKSYFDTIAKDLEEAAWIDGATKLTSLARIFLPLAVPAIVVTATFTFVNAWNEFVLALTMLRSGENYTLPLLVFGQVAGRYQIEWHHVMAATLLATVPVAIVFSLLQRYLIGGMTAGGVK
jgi:multiple sugar transport system permease protein